MSDIISIALAQEGTSESNRGHMKYINWYGGFGSGTPWCAIFVSWCANQAGVSTSIVPKFSAVSNGMSWFQNKGLFRKKGYTPKRGDIVFFKTGRSHTGLVVSSNGSTFQTIEGNSSNAVKQRSYSLGEKTLTGFGTPNYETSSSEKDSTGSGGGTSGGSSGGSSGSSGTGKPEKDYSQELGLLQRFLDHQGEVAEPIQGTVERNLSKANVDVSIIIENGQSQFIPPVLEDVELTLERVGTPGKLTFHTLIDSFYPIQEGNPVLLVVDGKKVFYGFVFTRETGKDMTWKVTVYDQLRYFKNKDTYLYSSKTASQLIQMIADDYQLQTGDIVDTGYAMSKIEDNSTLFDMVQNALDETMMSENQLYVLYDKVGELTLSSMEQMRVNSCVVDRETGEDFTYQVSIDSETYNQIKLAYENKETGTLDLYITKDSEHINEWGLLQYFEKIDSPLLGVLKSNVLLQVYNQKGRSLKITDAFGNTDVIAGCLIPVFLYLVDQEVQSYMLVEKVTHKFHNRVHSMDLILSGGGFHA